MQLNGFYLEPHAQIDFTAVDIDLLMEAAKYHYDDYCRSVGRAGGFLYGVAAHCKMVGAATCTISVNSRQLDTLCGIVELYKFHNTYDHQEPPKNYELHKLLYRDLFEALRQLNLKSNEVNVNRS